MGSVGAVQPGGSLPDNRGTIDFERHGQTFKFTVTNREKGYGVIEYMGAQLPAKIHLGTGSKGRNLRGEKEYSQIMHNGHPAVISIDKKALLAKADANLLSFETWKQKAGNGNKTVLDYAIYSLTPPVVHLKNEVESNIGELREMLAHSAMNPRARAEGNGLLKNIADNISAAAKHVSTPEGRAYWQEQINEYNKLSAEVEALASPVWHLRNEVTANLAQLRQLLANRESSTQPVRDANALLAKIRDNIAAGRGDKSHKAFWDAQIKEYKQLERAFQSGAPPLPTTPPPPLPASHKRQASSIQPPLPPGKV